MEGEQKKTKIEDTHSLHVYNVIFTGLSIVK